MSEIKIPPVTMGTDPEVFVVKEEDPGTAIPASVLGLKDIRSLKGSPVFGYDNVCLEFNAGPRTCLQELNAKLGEGIRKAYAAASSQKSIFSYDAIRKFPMEVLMQHEEAQTFACNPAYIVQDEEVVVNLPRCDPLDIDLRSAGYHVHIGISNACAGSPNPSPNLHVDVQSTIKRNNRTYEILRDASNHPKLAQMCDILVGLPAVMLDRSEATYMRRQYIGYGRASEFRSKPYGFEYRALSAWPIRSPAWAWWAHAAVRDAATILAYEIDLTNEVEYSEVAEAINSCDQETASELWTTVKTALHKHVWPKMYPASRKRVVMMSEQTVKHTEFYMANGIPTDLSMRDSWLNYDPMDVGFPSFATRHLNHSKKFLDFAETWTPKRNCVYE